jgi:hypothetical protein
VDPSWLDAFLPPEAEAPGKDLMQMQVTIHSLGPRSRWCCAPNLLVCDHAKQGGSPGRSNNQQEEEEEEKEK